MTKKKLKQQNEIMRKALLEIAGGTYDPDETIPDDDIRFHLFAARAAIRRMEGRAQFALNYVEELEMSSKWVSYVVPIRKYFKEDRKDEV